MPRLSVLFIFLCFFLACRKEGELYEPSPPLSGKTITAAEIQCFRQVTTNGKFNGDNIIKKWAERVVYLYLADTAYSYMVAELHKIVRDINSYTDTNLVLSVTTNRSLANIIIYPTDRQTFMSSVSGASTALNSQPSHTYGICMLKFDVNYNITGATIFVDMFSPANSPAYDRYLLRHEIMHSLGFLGHTEMETYKYSIISETNIFPYKNYFAEIDSTLIRILYHPAIHTGMRNEQLDSVLVKF
jgi:Protein of unknown function (DUF2927)